MLLELVVINYLHASVKPVDHVETEIDLGESRAIPLGTGPDIDIDGDLRMIGIELDYPPFVSGHDSDEPD